METPAFYERWLFFLCWHKAVGSHSIYQVLVDGSDMKIIHYLTGAFRSHSVTRAS